MATSNQNAQVVTEQRQQEPMSEFSKYLRYGIAGGACASLTHTVLVPVDVVKTRLQIHDKAYSGMRDAFTKIVRTEGVPALFLGLTPTAVGYSVQGALKFGGFEFLKHRVVDMVGQETAAKYNLPIYLTTSAIAEILATIALCPFEAIRIRAVAGLSSQHGSSGMLSTFSNMVRNEGFIQGAYKGLIPILLKQVPYTVTQITAFSKLVDYTYGSLIPKFDSKLTKEQMSSLQQLSVTIVCGTIAGVLSAIASHPPDVMLSRINAMEGQGLSNAQLLKKVYGELGWRGMWLGLGARCIMVGALSCGMFLIYDSVKLMVGLPTTSGLNAKKDE